MEGGGEVVDCRVTRRVLSEDKKKDFERELFRGLFRGLIRGVRRGDDFWDVTVGLRGDFSFPTSFFTPTTLTLPSPPSVSFFPRLSISLSTSSSSSSSPLVAKTSVGAFLDLNPLELERGNNPRGDLIPGRGEVERLLLLLLLLLLLSGL